jgi:hypothetical protein
MAVGSLSTKVPPLNSFDEKRDNPETRTGNDSPQRERINDRRQVLEQIVAVTCGAGSAAFLMGVAAPMEEAAASGGATAGRYTYVENPWRWIGSIDPQWIHSVVVWWLNPCQTR